MSKTLAMRAMLVHALLMVPAMAASAAPAGNDDFPEFEPVTIDPYVGEICYAVTVADVDGDGRTDIVAVTERQVLWYENPRWQKHVICSDQTMRDNVCIAPADFDRDGKVDFALGAGWTQTGTIQWLSRGLSLEHPWDIHPISEEPWLHRMRVADVLATGAPQLVVSPLNKSRGGGVRLMAFEVPDDPRSGRWRPTVLNHDLNRMHNHWHDDWDDDGVVDTLTASQEGVHLVRRTDQGLFEARRLSNGASGEQPEGQGAGEIKLGRMASGQKCIATIEPMHGNQVVIYAARQSQWERIVLDDSLGRGHAVWFADLDGHPGDELIIGHSDPASGPVRGPGLYIYKEDQPDSWRKIVLDDGGIATEDAIAADLNDDGWIDIIAGGRATHNLKCYLNQGPAK